MLAFEPQTSKDVLICQIYKNETSNVVVQDVYFSPIYKRDAESAIVTEDVMSVLRDDAFRLQREHGLSKVEYEEIVLGVKQNKPIDLNIVSHPQKQGPPPTVRKHPQKPGLPLPV